MDECWREKTHLFFFLPKKKKNISLPLSNTHTHTRRGKKRKFFLILFIPFLWVWGEPPPQSRKGICIIYVVFYYTTTCLASPVCAQVKWKSQKVDECKIEGGFWTEKKKWNEMNDLYYIFLPFGNDLLRLWKGEKPKSKRDGHEIHKNYPSSPIFFYPYFFFLLYIYIPCVTP